MVKRYERMLLLAFSLATILSIVLFTSHFYKDGEIRTPFAGLLPIIVWVCATRFFDYLDWKRRDRS
jgi:hypothetical protein